VADLEAEIHQVESRIEQLHQALASPDVLRDGEKVRQAKAELDNQQQHLSTLYEHWEEACELN
jgi:protein subunit release factor A